MMPEVVFVLENAAWPALLVNASGAVLRFNAAAKLLFGPALDGPAKLAAIWCTPHLGGPMGFLAEWEQSPEPQVELKFRVAGGLEKNFSTAIAIFPNASEKFFLLQLLAASAARQTAGIANRIPPTRWATRR